MGKENTPILTKHPPRLNGWWKSLAQLIVFHTARLAGRRGFEKRLEFRGVERYENNPQGMMERKQTDKQTAGKALGWAECTVLRVPPKNESLDGETDLILKGDLRPRGVSS